MVHPPSTLYVFYDLSVSTPKYDFLVFLQVADFHRRRHGHDKMHFIIVPGPKDGFRDSNLPPQDIDVLKGMVRNIVLPGCWLLPSCSGVSYLSYREEARHFLSLSKGNVFPRDYTLEDPKVDYLAFGINASLIRDEELPVSTAPKEYHEQAATYCRLTCGNKKIVTITMRECSYHPQRNSIIPEWQKFIDHIDKTKYAIIVVRDTEKIFAEPLFEGITECPLASISLGFRAALYEASYITLHVDNGTSCVANFTLAPSITFGFYSEGYLDDIMGFFKATMGQTYGDQWYGYPCCQKLVWEQETFEIIKAEFDRLVSIIETHPNGNFPPNDFSSPLQLWDTCNSVVEYTATKMVYSSQTEDRDLLLRVIELTEGGHAIAHNLLGVWYSNTGEPEKSVQAFHHAVTADITFKTAYMNLAAMLQNIGKPSEAFEIFERALNNCGEQFDIFEAAISGAVLAKKPEVACDFLKMAEVSALHPDQIQALKSAIPVP